MGRTLVLGGGGITGIAWELGVLAGLHESGIDLSGADTVIGTSAGSVVGAQITSGAALEDLYARQLRPPDGEIGARLPPASSPAGCGRSCASATRAGRAPASGGWPTRDRRAR